MDIGVQSRGTAAPPPDSGKTIIFQAKTNCSGRSQQPKMKRKILYLLNEKNGIHSVEQDKVPEMLDFY